MPAIQIKSPALTLKAGRRALARIRERGLQPADVGIVPGAAGGPKALGIQGLDLAIDPEVDEQRLRYREAYAALFVELLEEGRRSGAFQLSLVPLAAACLVGAIAEALVGPLSPPARAARDSGQPEPSLEPVSTALVNFCLRAVGAPVCEEPS